MDNIVDLRNTINKKRPHFYNQGSRKKKKCEKKWRKPRGSDSKVMLCRKGYPVKVKKGFRGPIEARNLSKEGFAIINIYNIDDLKKVNKTKNVVCIANVGLKKKIDIIKGCIKIGLKMINCKDPQKFLSEVDQYFKSKKEQKDKKEKEKAKKTESKKQDKKEGIEEKVGEVESKEINKSETKSDKKEKDKVLTKREI